MKAKRCRCCHRWFHPDPRTPHQEVCFRKSCRKKRKAQAQANWHAKNPDYFRGPEHYARTKAWLAKNPGYRRRYWAANPEYAAADNRQRPLRKQRQKRRRADMKDAFLRREITRIRGLRGADIQDTIRLRLDELLAALAHPPRADIQDAIDPNAAGLVPSPP